jgi:two-component system response regulator MprA
MSESVRSILVVDDDWDIRQTLADLLRDGGWDVTTATDGFDALEKLGSLRCPCLVLLDLMMPRMSGLEFLRCLSERERTDDFTVVVMSAHDGLRREAGRHPRVCGTLPKPFDSDELLSMVADQHRAAWHVHRDSSRIHAGG